MSEAIYKLTEEEYKTLVYLAKAGIDAEERAARFIRDHEHLRVHGEDSLNLANEDRKELYRITTATETRAKLKSE